MPRYKAKTEVIPDTIRLTNKITIIPTETLSRGEKKGITRNSVINKVVIWKIMRR